MNLQADRQQNWNRISRRLQTTPSDSSLRILILAAHPDDETIGASLLLSRFPQSAVVFLTDGAPRDTRFWSAQVNGSREAYAETRRLEAFKALNYAGVSQNRIFWLAGVDQEAAFEIPTLAGRFAKIVSEMRPETLITHTYEGGHPDHDSAAVVAGMAMPREISPLLVEMTSYHAQGGGCVTGEFLNMDPASQLCFELSNPDRDRKRQMMDAYASQRLVLENFPIDCERLRLAPEYNFAEPPHSGKLWYECMGWPMTGVRWRELATSALAGLQEHSCR